MRKERKCQGKGYLQFALITLAGGVVGGVGSVLLSTWDKGMVSMAKQLNQSILTLAPFLMIGCSVIGIAVNAVMVQKAKKNFVAWDGEDEVKAEQIERFNERCQGVISCMVTFTLSVSGINLLGITGDDRMLSYVMAGCLFFVIYALSSALSLNWLVEQIKRMNPEKKGNALTLSFNKDWIKSCDEQEKARTFEAAYQAYLYSQYLYGGIFVVLILLSTALDIGVLPFILVGMIWMFQNIIYVRNYNKKRK